MSDARDLRLDVDFPAEDAGWINSYLTFDGVTHQLDTTCVFPPFEDMLVFLRSLVANRLPAWFYWEMEGHGAYFEAWPVDGSDENFHLRVFTDRNNQLLVDADLGRMAVAEVFVAPLREMALYCDPEILDEYDLSLKEIVKYEQFLLRDIAPRSNINRAEAVIFEISGGNPSCQSEIEAWALERRFIKWRMEDSDGNWAGWFQLLENVLNNVPSNFTYYNKFWERQMKQLISKGVAGITEYNKDWSSRAESLPLDHPRHFRLRVYENGWSMHLKNFMAFDEVLDRAQFATAFLDAFETRLAKGYQPVPDEDGTVFDLRELPVTRLREQIARISA